MFAPSLTKKIKGLIFRTFLRIIQAPRIVFYKLISTPILYGKPNLRQPLLVCGDGKIKIADNVFIGYFPSPLFLSTYAHIEARNIGSSISIGSGTLINNNFSAIAEFTNITIGNNVLIGVNVGIIDSDFHGISLKNRKLSLPEWAKPVVIEDDVFIGSNVQILKGVKIGSRAVIANGSVVVKDIPDDALAGGNPAYIIKILE